MTVVTDKFGRLGPMYSWNTGSRQTHFSDEDFIVDDTPARDYLEDRSYVPTISEDEGDEEEKLSYLLEIDMMNNRFIVVTGRPGWNLY